jgi:hypothetical protein
MRWVREWRGARMAGRRKAKRADEEKNRYKEGLRRILSVYFFLFE